MRKFSYTFALLLAASIVFTSCNTATSNKGVVVNGVRWATYNVETPGTFAKNIESTGGFFTWEEAKNACPCGWRLPTREEFESLSDVADSEWITVNGVNGRTFGTMPNQLFLPAAGNRGTDGTFRHVADVAGWYWGSAQGASATTAWNLLILDGITQIWSSNNRSNRFTVRCVAE